ncbi:ABC transporter permease [Thermomonospora sp. CIF 1]|uniref:Transport permease protein n=1 Tax=Thermomonospora curvata (strain ATCC 19995 / DSM 43183 / JCM 3096 / KCTC 9072 / NBRC 15933 / NCIMB 10081 / Henssen B9) TaxID=471852 RepID=D1A244_THECD|nr:ABC transporter permease [Thermomonospora sp. CIF 1]ACY99697.1 ABC-2 type transporter [Thermomonospora curvata DSM 43183]PKK12713.1 MAG: multidrug ABC transporter permease [Thermomonospora sp. CIF 1]
MTELQERTALPQGPADEAGTVVRTTMLSDIAVVFTRELRPLLRDPFSLVFAMVQPLFFLALFGPLLPDGVGGGAALQWFVPGIIVMSCLFAGSATGSNLLYEMQTGSHERMLVSPLRRPALIVGRALKEIVPSIGQALLIIAVTVPFGFRPDPLGTVPALLIVATFTVGLGGLSYALALASKNKESLFWIVQQTLLFPLLLLAGMLLPVDQGPAWLQVLSKFNPLTYVVDAERALFNGEPVSATVAYGVLSAVAMALVGLQAGITAMRRA